jgi:CBS domain-containing protein
MQVQELMSRDVISVSPDAAADAAARMLSRHNIGALPVCTAGGQVRGMITDRDIALRCVAAGKDPKKTPIREIMSSRVVGTSPEEDVEQAAKRMAREQVRRLPVLEQGRLVGMLSLGDLSVNRTMQMEASACLAEISSQVHHR